MLADTLSLEEKVAQRFIVGYRGVAPNAVTQRFLSLGVGGLIFFRDNLDPLPDAGALYRILQEMPLWTPCPLPRPWLCIDQEGGAVERLPHRYFPTGLMPRAIADAPESLSLARDVYRAMAQRLRQLGFTMNFFPTLDVNVNPANPVIGARSFGDNPSTVWQFARIAMEEHLQAGIIPVGKHFPGHGNGTVDSHLDLPVLHFTDAECWAFQQAIQAGLPAMMTAHGYYPQLQPAEVEKSLPSSASPTVIQGLLRRTCGFEGVIITDDMLMGAITRYRDPIGAAMAAIRAGADVLLYRDSTACEWSVYQAIVQAYQHGMLPLDELNAAVERIGRLKTRQAAMPQPAFVPEAFSSPACQHQASAWLQRALTFRRGSRQSLAAMSGPLLLVHPNRRDMGNYAFDEPTSADLPDCFNQAGITALQSVPYSLHNLDHSTGLPEWAQEGPGNPLNRDLHFAMPAGVVCMVAFNARAHPEQVRLFEIFAGRFPEAGTVLISVGWPDDGEFFPSVDVHLHVGSYRPAALRLIAGLFNAFQG